VAESRKVTLTLEAEGARKPETAEILPSLGAVLDLAFGNAETTWRVDYREPDRLRLRIDGSVRLVDRRDLTISTEGRLVRDFVEADTTVTGALEMVFDRWINVEITGSSGPDGKRVGAGIRIEF
jgi:hypothetical protein